MENNKDKSFYFFDESRFGTYSNLGYGWFKKGSRTEIKVKLGFQNFYLYSAVNPKTGEDFTCQIPHINTDWMNLFLKELSFSLKNKEIFLIMDGAGWHKSNALKIPSNIDIIYLPPYSPELNPVERLWQYTKFNTIRNKIYETIEELEEVVCDFVQKYDHDTIRSICAFNY
jgi:transposase